MKWNLDLISEIVSLFQDYQLTVFMLLNKRISQKFSKLNYLNPIKQRVILKKLIKKLKIKDIYIF
jgi:hypothetical protein